MCTEDDKKRTQALYRMTFNHIFKMFMKKGLSEEPLQ